MVIDKDTLHRISSHEAAKAELENIKQEVIHVDQELEEDRKKYSILQGEYNRLVADLRELEFTENNEANGPTNEFANPMTEGAVLTKEQQDNMLVEEVIRNLKEQIAQEEQECIKLQNSLNSSMNGSKMLENMFFILQNIEHSKGGPILEPSDYSQLNKLYLDKLLAVIMLITETCKAHKISDFVYESVLDYESNFWYNSFDEFQMAGNVFTNTPNITTSNSNNATNSNTRYLWSIILKLLTKEMYTDELASQLVSLGAINAASEFQPNKMLYPLFARNIVELKPQNDGKVKVTPTWVTL
ncbi:hypothetical protein AX774_g8229 [Zancudomyces culisetae]|nr:hypothetical protein AX774_g8229 [Zancudomyces culisetae]|eukprot:OMH78384.1 hypothetical protein AX774_g8229 [Zancudomyces culisetae]